MKKIFFVLLSIVVCVNASAQKSTTVEEPEFFSTYHILVSDTTMMPLPKEKGKIGSGAEVRG